MGLSTEEITARVKEAAAFAGLADELLEKSPFELSGGQKRRAAIAGVMAMRPEILVLDEPAAGLDPMGREEIFAGLARYRAESGATVVVVSHSMEDMARFCDEIIVMDHARVRMVGKKEEIFSHAETLIDAGLDVPEITKLIGMLRERGVEVDSSIYTVSQAEEALWRLFENGSQGGQAK